MDTHPLGSAIQVDATFEVDEVLTDPTTLTLEVEDPTGEITLYTYPSAPITRTSAGVYYAILIPAAEGVWRYRFQGTGAAHGAVEGAFRIFSSINESLSFLITPDDWNSIRAVLGVTELDLVDADLERALFAGQAELRVKNRLTDWAEIIEDPDRAFVLRMAAAYATAALVAESYARGGTIDNVAPNETGAGGTHGWASHASLLWGRHEEWMAIAEAWDLEPSDIYDLHAAMASGPTKRYARSLPMRLDTPPWAKGLGVYWDGWTT